MEEKIIESPHSVKLSINAKGLFSGEVKVYGSTPELALSKCAEITKEVEEVIRKKNNL